MARSYLEKPNYLYYGGKIDSSSSLYSDCQFEFDESDLWNSSQNVVPKTKRYQKTHPLPMTKPSKRSQLGVGSVVDGQSNIASSLPVDVPDWSKILRDEYKENRSKKRNDTDVDDDVEEDDYRIPPHEYLARTRVASFSVHEGIGRTLKGRDLSRVRNAIWEQTGFELD